jgi:hypothetical protein
MRVAIVPFSGGERLLSFRPTKVASSLTDTEKERDNCTSYLLALKAVLKRL